VLSLALTLLARPQADDIGDRVSIILTLLLTSVAFKLALGDSLPKVPVGTAPPCKFPSATRTPLWCPQRRLRHVQELSFHRSPCRFTHERRAAAVEEQAAAVPSSPLLNN
jgi:hypothetical protein